MQKIKSLIIKILTPNQKKKMILMYKIYRTNRPLTFRLKKMISIFFNSKIVKVKELQGEQFKKVYSKSKIKIDESEIFAYSIDFLTFPAMENPNSFGNLTVDYNEILKLSINDLYSKYSDNDKYCKNMHLLIEGIDIEVDKMIKAVDKSNIKNKSDIINTFLKIKNGKISTMFEAMQKILFYNQLLWQSDVTLIGLGRLDKILDPYYKNDIKNNIDNDNIKEYIKSFYRLLHKHFYFKSGALIGDTGQIIIIGGKDKNNNYFCNRLTYLFLEALKEIKLPDPKILLRVSSTMPDDLLKLSLDTVCTGIGSPLFANDDIIIKKLIDFGWKEESYNYVTSACWEPFLASKTSDQNNLLSINFLEPLNKMLDEENLNEIKSKKDLLDHYDKYLNEYLKEFKKQVDKFKFNNNCLLSLFYSNCLLTKKDIGLGGALYNNYGVTSVGLSSTINSMLNIDKLVFNAKKYTLLELNEMRKDNFNCDYIIEILKNGNEKYGSDNEEVIDITNKILKRANTYLKDYKNYFGGKIKFGLSSPSYIIDSKNSKASLDGRKDSEPFTVHISSASAGYTELFNFASKIEYGELGFNGNVIDFMVSPSFIKNNFDKFMTFFKCAVENGFFETQFNVIDSQTLIAAKNDPSSFPNLIVRVWGFSTYFNELPEEYKSLLIERAIASENNCN